MKNQQFNTPEIIEAVTPQIITKPAPVEIYKSVKHKRELRIKAVFCVILAVEVIISVLFGLQIKENQIASRFLKEIENMSTGQIVTAGGVYTGTTDFGAFVGEGTFKSNTGTTYQGTWVDNSIVGQGSILVPSIGSYSGDFLDSKKSGIGTFAWDDGSVYEGEWRNDAMDGQGSYTSNSGVTYVGTFRGNLFSDGTCTFTNETGDYSLFYVDKQIDKVTIRYTSGVTYSGDCGINTIDRTGVMSYPNGDNYSGSYEGGKRCGQGIYTWNFGDKYDGTWSNDFMDGLGTYTFASGEYYTGTFKEGTFLSGAYHVENNFGEYTFTIKDRVPETVDMVLSDGTTYSGDITADGKLTGSAQIQYSNGDRYSGKVEDGLKTGQGQYSWSSGASYDGSWKNDKMNGQGVYMYPSAETGFKLTGTFSDGLPSGECYYYTTSSTKFKTDWSNGTCIKIYE